MIETHQTKSLEDRIIDYVADKTSFTFKTLREFFTQDSDRAIYRALNDLEEQHRIKFLTWSKRQKVYSCSGISKLPILKLAQGSADLSELTRNITGSYDSAGNWPLAKRINQLPVVMSTLFVVAQNENGKGDYFETIRTLQKYKADLMLALGFVDSVLNHPTMNGDFEHFREIFTSKEAPTAQELLEFRRWASKTFSEEEATSE